MVSDVYNKENKKAGTVELPDNVFKVKWNSGLVREAVAAQLASGRKPLAHTKTRGEVRGGGRKPWRQKHTGRARHGSIRSPLWEGGGVTFGPRKEKKYGKKINKKMKNMALFSILSKKLRDEEIKILEDLNLKERKTKEVAKILREFLGRRKSNVLVIPRSENKYIFSAGRNIEGVKILDPKSLNVYDCLRHKYIFMEKEAVGQFTKHYKKS